VDQFFYAYVENIDNVLLCPGCAFHGIKGCVVRLIIRRFDVEIVSDFYDMRCPSACIVVPFQHFHSKSAANEPCYVFGNIAWNFSEKYEVTQPLSAF
jgi:hypothetical protein